MKINELKQKINEIEVRMNAISDVEEMTDELRTEFDAKEVERQALRADLKRKEVAQAIELQAAEKEEVRIADPEKSLGEQFRNFLSDAVNGRGPVSFRVEPMLSTSNTDIINKVVDNSLDILVSPGEAFLRTLGVTFYPGLTGNFVVPSMAEDTATFPGENTDAADASMNVVDLVLAARRVTHAQSITKETLAQTNPAIYNGIVQNLVNGIWNAVTNDVFDTIQTDAATQVVGMTAAGLQFGDLVNMEASIGGLQIGQGAYVTTPAVKGYLKQKTSSTYGDFIWMDNEVNGYPSYGVPAANANKIYFGDFSKCAVGQWGGIEIIVDNLTSAKAGKINLTAVALVDTGVTNKLGINFSADVSAAV